MTGPTHDPTPTPELSQRLGGRFRLLRRLSQGGMGAVYEARDEQLGRSVAIKLLHEPDDRAALERFRREAQAVAALDHPRIVSIYDYGVDDGRHYLVLELVPGRDLASLLADEGPFTPSRAVETAAQVCEALAHAHAAGVVHRDITPANILIARGGEVRVTDFGIARMADAAQLTAAGSMMGTARYCAPEQVSGEPVGPGADLYALGVVLYEMLTGRPPFDGEHPAGVATRRLTEPVPPPSLARPDLPGWLDAVVARATARDPGDRYATADEFRDALRDPAGAAANTRATRPLSTITAPAEQTLPVREAVQSAAARWRAAAERVHVPRRALLPTALFALVLLALPHAQQPSVQQPPATPPTSAATTPAAPASPTPAAAVEMRPAGTAPPPDATYEITRAVIGLDGAEVADTLRRNGFDVVLRHHPSDQPAGTVTDVDPAVGDHVRPGDTITLYTAAD